MATVVANMSMSLDGFIADPADGTDRLFGWCADPNDSTTALLQDVGRNLKTILVGRRTFDTAAGWGGAHPLGVPVFVVTHRPPDGWDDAPFTFVTEGIESAVSQAKAAAGGGIVGVSGADVVQRCIKESSSTKSRSTWSPCSWARASPFSPTSGHRPSLKALVLWRVTA
jgi:dihydrofolate reductase